MTYALCSITHRKTPNLPEISWFESPFWCFFCWSFVWFNHEQTPQLSSFIWTEKLSSTPPKIISRLVTHMKYLHTCLAEISPLPFTLQKTLFCWFFKIRSNGKFQNTQWELSQRTRVRFSISLYSDFKINRRIFVSREKWSGDITAKQECKCFIWVTNLGTINRRVLPTAFLALDRQWKVRHLFIWWRAPEEPSNLTSQNQQKAPKNSYKPATFRQILQCTCDWVSYTVQSKYRYRLTNKPVPGNNISQYSMVVL